MFRQYQKIMIVNGDLLLWEDGGSGRSYPCPFAYPTPCGTWCPHFGEVKHSNGDPRLDYALTLNCCGTLIFAKEFEVVSFDASKGSSGVGKPVQQYKEMPKPAGKSREIAWSEAFSFASLVRAYNQCRRKRKKPENKQ